LKGGKVGGAKERKVGAMVAREATAHRAHLGA
jgi:hypothetical protein